MPTSRVPAAVTSTPSRSTREIAARVAKLVSASEIRVSRDNQRQLLTLELKEGRDGFLPAKALSDGTLRFLALCILDADPDVGGLICMEEPENGLHPARMQAMVDLVRGLAVDPMQRAGPENPLRQVIINTHSPAFVQLQGQEDILFAESVTVRGPKDKPVGTLRLAPIRGQWRSNADNVGVGLSDVIAYLTNPPNARLRLELFDAEKGV